MQVKLSLRFKVLPGDLNGPISVNVGIGNEICKLL